MGVNDVIITAAAGLNPNSQAAARVPVEENANERPGAADLVAENRLDDTRKPTAAGVHCNAR
jgi:hypothetical protein